MSSKHLQPIRDLLPDASLYALVDTALKGPPAERVLKLNHRVKRCLFRGSLGETLRDVAPYLIDLKAQTTFARWFLGPGNGLQYGLAFESPAGLDELNAHFRHLLLAGVFPLGPALHFRFYDARVWPAWLPNCPPDRLRAMFGPVDRFFLATDEEMHTWSLSRAGRCRLSRSVLTA
ncbi:MAG: DUF4123 domain-containing protein [Acidobacteriota bacterium]|nr:DUF4123 domain-containing protein [Acidobacteriota bacterium]